MDAELTMDPVRLDILNVAMAEFAEHGLAGARVDAIAARMRTSKRMIYYHFGSKEALYAATLTHAYASIRSDPPAPDLATLPPLQALAAYAGHVFDLHTRHPHFVRLVMGENLLGGRFVKVDDDIRQRNLQGLAELSAVIERGQAAGVMRREVRPFDVYSNMVALAFHFVSNRPTFSAIFEPEQDAAHTQAARRHCIIDTLLRQVQAGHTPEAP